HLGQVAGGGQAGRARADDGHLVPVEGGHGGAGMDVFPVPVGHKALQAADAHRLVLDAAGAAALALALLGTDPAADGGHGRVLADDLIGGFKVALGHLGDELGDLDAHGAALDAGPVLAVDAALGLVDGHLGGVAQRHLVKVVPPDLGVLGGHGALFGVHIESHGHFTSILNRWQASSRACASKGRYIEPRAIASSKSTRSPSKSGPSTQANFSLPPTVRRQPPHMPVPSIMMGFMETTLLMWYFWQVLTTNFIMIRGPMVMTSSYWLPAAISSSRAA